MPSVTALPQLEPFHTIANWLLLAAVVFDESLDPAFRALCLRLPAEDDPVVQRMQRVRERDVDGRVKVTEAEIVYVHVDRNNRPIPLAAGQEGGGEEGER